MLSEGLSRQTLGVVAARVAAVAALIALNVTLGRLLGEEGLRFVIVVPRITTKRAKSHDQ